MNAEKLNIERRILMTKQEYSFWRVNLESDECGEPNGVSVPVVAAHSKHIINEFNELK